MPHRDIGSQQHRRRMKKAAHGGAYGDDGQERPGIDRIQVDEQDDEQRNIFRGIAVGADHLERVRAAVRERIALDAADAELAGLSRGTRVTRAQSVAVPHEQPPPSGLIELSDAVLASADLPAVLAIEPPPVHEPLALDLEPGELGPEPAELDEPEDLPPERTSAGAMIPMEPPTSEFAALVTEGPSLDDPDADLASLLGESDPMRDDEGSAPLALGEFEPEATTMFSAEDAARYSRPPPPLADEDADAESVELELGDDMIEIEAEDAGEGEQAAAPRTAPPPPPKTAPPPPGSRPSEAPARGFLGKLLQRKP